MGSLLKLALAAAMLVGVSMAEAKTKRKVIVRVSEKTGKVQFRKANGQWTSSMRKISALEEENGQAAAIDLAELNEEQNLLQTANYEDMIEEVYYDDFGWDNDFGYDGYYYDDPFYDGYNYGYDAYYRWGYNDSYYRSWPHYYYYYPSSTLYYRYNSFTSYRVRESSRYSYYFYRCW